MKIHIWNIINALFALALVGDCIYTCFLAQPISLRSLGRLEVLGIVLVVWVVINLSIRLYNAGISLSYSWSGWLVMACGFVSIYFFIVSDSKLNTEKQERLLVKEAVETIIADVDSFHTTHGYYPFTLDELPNAKSLAMTIPIFYGFRYDNRSRLNPSCQYHDRLEIWHSYDFGSGKWLHVG